MEPTFWDMLLRLVAAVILGDVLTAYNLAGLGLCLVGLAMYHRLKQQPPAPAAAEGEPSLEQPADGTLRPADGGVELASASRAHNGVEPEGQAHEEHSERADDEWDAERGAAHDRAREANEDPRSTERAKLTSGRRI